MADLNGHEYRVRAEHPRRPGPLRITAADGTVIAESGQTCEHVTPEHLASMLANGYLERVDEPAVPVKKPTRRGSDHGEAR